MNPTRRMLVVAGLFAFLTGAVIGQTHTASLLFPDVPEDAYYTGPIEDLARAGIVTGYSDGTFGPKDTVTRGQVATMIRRYDNEVVEPLRKQITALRSANNLGYCGDSTIQVGEECDDGNTINGDGCNGYCLTEVEFNVRECDGGLAVGDTFDAGDGCNSCICQEDLSIFCTKLDCSAQNTCEGGYTAGDSFLADDGCNTCTCEQGGLIACTEMACTDVTTCFSSDDCNAPQVCSTVYGDCFSACPDGEVCMDVCTGFCTDVRSHEKPTTCGNGLCDPEEEETDNFPGTCPEDCAAANAACEEKRNELDQLFADNLSCDTDADCTIFLRACSPYLTCGKAVARRSLQLVTKSVETYVSSCRGNDPIACAGCTHKEAICSSGQCVISE